VTVSLVDGFATGLPVSRSISIHPQLIGSVLLIPDGYVLHSSADWPNACAKMDRDGFALSNVLPNLQIFIP
jgi:hypothetical protein